MGWPASKLLLAYCVCLALSVECLQSISMNMDLPEEDVGNLVADQEAPLRSSPAAVAIQDGNAVRRILRQRSSRGKTRGVLKMKSAVKPSKLKRSSKISITTRSAIKSVDISYESTIEVLRIFYERQSNLALPRTTIVPAEEEFPREWHGLDIAGTVYDMAWWQRHVKQRPDRVAELNNLGFVWERLQPEWNLVLEGLVTYGIIYGDLMVPAQFIIPHDDNQWPTALWGMALGNSVTKIRNRGDFIRESNSWSRRDQLDAIGFVWDIQEYKFKIFCDALQAFSDVEERKRGPKRVGAIKLPAQFVIPSSDEWPKGLWGYNLGAKCTAVRQKELYVKGRSDRLKVLTGLGFVLGGNGSLSWLEVVHAAAIFSQMNHRKLEVPQNFVVPAPPRRVDSSVIGSDEAWPWPGKDFLLHLY